VIENWPFITNPKAIGDFKVKIGESLRVTSEAPQYFAWPYETAQQEIASKRNHLVFGRRGSGKTSLLRKLEEEIISNDGFCAFIDVENFKSLTLPDQIISGLVKLFEQLLEGKRNVVECLARDLTDLIKSELLFLRDLKEQADTVSVEIRETSQIQSTTDAGVRGVLALPLFQVRAAVGARQSEGGESTQVQIMESVKLDQIRRRISHHEMLLNRVRANFSGPMIVVFDDFYHLSLSTQPYYLDHFHGLFKQFGIFLKIGSIKTRSLWHWRLRNQTFGLEVPNDADEINLDRALEYFALTRQFLRSIVDSVARECALDTSQVITDGGFNRLVQASGGVARDCLSLLRTTLQLTQTRIANERSTSQELKGAPRVTADDIWQAASEHNQEKKEQFQQDAEIYDQRYYLLKLGDLVQFCYGNNINCFLVERAAPRSLVADLTALWDAKFIHIVDERLRFDGKDFTVYCLDLGVHAHERVRRQIVVDFSDISAEQFRRRQLVYSNP
jgi:hypothetical protein